MKLLVLHSSPNLETSFSRKWTLNLVKHLQAKNPGLNVFHRDIVKDSIPHITPALLSAFPVKPADRTPQQAKDIELSDKLVTEFLESDMVVVGAPMYNFTVPSVLKAYIDMIVRVGRTFEYTPTGPKGLVSAEKKMYFVTSSGGVYSEGPAKGYEHLSSYFQAIFGFLGVRKMEFVQLEGTAMGPDSVNATEAKAQQKILSF